MAEVSLVKLPLDKCHLTLPMISQHWFRWWLGGVRQQAITWASVDPDICSHMASLGPNMLINAAVQWMYSHMLSSPLLSILLWQDVYLPISKTLEHSYRPTGVESLGRKWQALCIMALFKCCHLGEIPMMATVCQVGVRNKWYLWHGCYGKCILQWKFQISIICDSRNAVFLEYFGKFNFFHVILILKHSTSPSSHHWT